MTCTRHVLSGKVRLPGRLLLSCLAGALFAYAPAQMVTKITLNPTSLTGGKSFTGTVTLSANAPAGGFTGDLTSGDANATVPATFTVSAGQKTGAFTASTSPVSALDIVAIQATGGGGSASANLTINSPIFKSMTVAPNPTDSGKNVNATVTLTGPAPTGGVAFSITSDNAVAVPATNLSVAAGSTNVVVPIIVGTVAAATVANLTLVPSISQSGSFVVPLTVNLPVAKSLTISPTTLITSQTASAMVIVNGFAPAGGYPVSITCSATGITFPSTVTIGPGTDNAKFTLTVTPAAQGGPVTFSATFNGVTVSTNIGIQATGLDLLAPWPKFRGSYTNQGVGNNILGTSTLATTNVLYMPSVSYDAIESSPAIGADGTIYLETGDGILHGFLPNGADKWGSNPAIFGQYVSSVTLVSPTTVGAAETLYVGGQTGGNNSGPDALLSINASTGAVNWAYDIPTSTHAPRWVVSSPAVAVNGTIYAPSLNGYLYALTPAGTLAWSYETAGASIVTDAGAEGIESSPAIAPDGTIYFGSDDGHLYALRPNGTLKWTYPNKGAVGSMQSSPSIGADGTVYVGSDDGNLYAITPTGAKRWSASIGAQAWYSSPVIGPDGTVYICNDPMQYGSIYAFNGATGTKKWQFSQVNIGGVISPQAGFKGSPALAPGGLNNAGVLFVGGMDGVLYGVNAADGSLYGSVALGTQALMGSPALASNGTIYIASHSGVVWSIQ